MRIKLRNLDEADCEKIIEQFNIPAVVRWLSVPSPFTARDFSAFLARVRIAGAAGKRVDCVGAHEDGRFLGAVSLDTRTAELSFWVAREHWGCGIGQALVSAFIAERVSRIPTAYIVAAVHESNNRASSLLERCEFRYIGQQYYCYGNTGMIARLYRRILCADSGC